MDRRQEEFAAPVSFPPTAALTADTGYFRFFGADDVEVIVKVLDACGVNRHHWVFGAGLTNLDVEMTATDTVTGTRKQCVNPLGTQSVPVQDTSAFSCPGVSSAPTRSS